MRVKTRIAIAMLLASITMAVGVLLQSKRHQEAGLVVTGVGAVLLVISSILQIRFGLKASAKRA